MFWDRYGPPGYTTTLEFPRSVIACTSARLAYQRLTSRPNVSVALCTAVLVRDTLDHIVVS